MPLNLLYFTVLSLIINTWNSIFINFLKKKKKNIDWYFLESCNLNLQRKIKKKKKKQIYIRRKKKSQYTKIRSKKKPRDRWLAFGASFKLIAGETQKTTADAWLNTMMCCENWNFRTHSHYLTRVVGQFLLLTYELKIESCWTWSIEQMLLKLGTYLPD